MTDSDRKLSEAPLPQLIFSLALPSIAAQLINLLYNIVDRIYIGHIKGIGDIALTGIGLTMPIIMIISAFSAFVGFGGAPIASMRMGHKDYDGAEDILGCGFSMLLMCALVLTVFIRTFATPILYLFGAGEQSFVYAKQYLDIYILGTVLVQLALGLNPYISSQGKAKTAMLSVLIGAVINIILDPIFIFVFNMGVRGAALATIISQFVSSVWILCFLMSKRSVIRIKLSKMKIKLKTLIAIVSLGISPFIMQSTEGLVSITFNTGLQKYGGELYVGSMTILMSIMQLCVIPMQGFTQGIQPIISYNYGAGNRERIIKTFKITVSVCFSFSMISCILMSAFSGSFVRLFNDEPELLALTSRMLPVFIAGMSIFGLQSSCQSTFMGLGQAKISLFLALLRKVVLLIPLAIVLPRVFGTPESIYYAEPIADGVASLVTFTMFVTHIKGILANMPKPSDKTA